MIDNQRALPAYIKELCNREARARRRAKLIAWSTAGGFAALSALLFLQWQRTAAAQKETQASLWIAESQALLHRNLPAALDRARRAFASVPTEQSRSTLLAALMEVSPHLVGTANTGETNTALTWVDHGTVVIATGSGHVGALKLRPDAGIEQGQTWNVRAPMRDGGLGRSYVRSFHAIAPERLVAVFADGGMGIMERSTAEPQLRTATGPSLNTAADAVAIGPQGTLIAMADADGRLTLHRCDWARAADPCRPPESVQTIRANALAINRNGTLLAVADAAGTVTLLAADGKPIRQFDRVDELIVSLRWALDRDWIGVGTAKGTLAIFDAGSSTGAAIHAENVGDRPVSALAWHPTEPGLAFVCSAADWASVCVWYPGGDATGHPFKPPLHLDGHANAVVRIAWAPGGAHLASSDVDGAVRVWTMRQNTDGRYFLRSEHPAALSAIASAPDGKTVAAGAVDGTIHQWTTEGLVATRSATSGKRWP